MSKNISWWCELCYHRGMVVDVYWNSVDNWKGGQLTHWHWGWPLSLGSSRASWKLSKIHMGHGCVSQFFRVLKPKTVSRLKHRKINVGLNQIVWIWLDVFFWADIATGLFAGIFPHVCWDMSSDGCGRNGEFLAYNVTLPGPIQILKLRGNGVVGMSERGDVRHGMILDKVPSSNPTLKEKWWCSLLI